MIFVLIPNAEIDRFAWKDKRGKVSDWPSADREPFSCENPQVHLIHFCKLT
jgi:hypothetical protein